MCQGPVGSARWRTVELPVRGQQNCPAAARCSARGSVGQWRHPLAGGGYRTYLLARPAHQPAPTPTSPAGLPRPGCLPTYSPTTHRLDCLPPRPTYGPDLPTALCYRLAAHRPDAHRPDPLTHRLIRQPWTAGIKDRGTPSDLGDRGPVRPIKRSGVSRSRRRGGQAWASEIGVPAQTIPPTHHPTGPGPYSDSGSSIPSALTPARRSVGSAPSALTPARRSVGSAPSALTPARRSVGSAPSALTPARRSVGSAPSALTPARRSVGSAPSALTPARRSVGSAPSALTPARRSVGSAPSALTIRLGLRRSVGSAPSALARRRSRWLTPARRLRRLWSSALTYRLGRVDPSVSGSGS